MVMVRNLREALHYCIETTGKRASEKRSLAS
jgi:hypothetical protein